MAIRITSLLAVALARAAVTAAVLVPGGLAGNPGSWKLDVAGLTIEPLAQHFAALGAEVAHHSPELIRL
jgi:hypothetical protein